ncbi:MAG: DUF268 domain-containing protein, partial [Thermodesulfobacteriota bacterium]
SMCWLLLYTSFFGSIFASPPREVPAHLYDAFTLGKTIPVYSWYIDNSYPRDQPLVFRVEEIDRWINKAKQREKGYYGETDRYLYEILDQYASWIEGKRVGIIGSTIPWYESMILAYGGQCTTIDYNKIVSEDPRIQTMTVEEYEQNPQKFDVILSISSLEHDGLGRYGDPINPNGDLETMFKMKRMLSKEGFLILAVPVGKDAIYWNAHRVYGALRLPLLFGNWQVVDSRGFVQSDLDVNGYAGHQPVFVLQICSNP